MTRIQDQVAITSLNTSLHQGAINVTVEYIITQPTMMDPMRDWFMRHGPGVMREYTINQGPFDSRCKIVSVSASQSQYNWFMLKWGMVDTELDLDDDFEAWCAESGISLDYAKWTDRDRVLVKLRWYRVLDVNTP